MCYTFTISTDLSNSYKWHKDKSNPPISVNTSYFFSANNSRIRYCSVSSIFLVRSRYFLFGNNISAIDIAEALSSRGNVAGADWNCRYQDHSLSPSFYFFFYHKARSDRRGGRERKITEKNIRQLSQRGTVATRGPKMKFNTSRRNASNEGGRGRGRTTGIYICCSRNEIFHATPKRGNSIFSNIYNAEQSRTPNGPCREWKLWCSNSIYVNS